MYNLPRPSGLKQEYHGNGKNAWHGSVELVAGHKIEKRSIRYSYRWHKTWIYVDGIRVKSRWDYARAEALINADINKQ